MALTQRLTEQQLKENIDHLLKNGQSKQQVQEYVNNYKKDNDGSYVLGSSQITQQTTQTQPKKEKGNLLDLGVGAAKGVASTASGMSSLGQKLLEGTVGKALGAKKSEKTVGQQVQEKIKPTNTMQKIGFGAEQIGEFLAPGTSSLKIAGAVKGSKALNTLTKSEKIKNLAGLTTRATSEAGIIGGQTAMQKGEVGDEVKTAAIIGGMFPIFGSGAGKIGSGVKGIGEKIQRSVIKPSIRDMEDGFKIANVNKYNVGGSLADTLSKTSVRLNKLSEQLNNKLKSSTNTVDLNDILKRTQISLSGNKAGNFGDIKSTKNVLQKLSEEINEVSENGMVNLINANAVKRGAGTKGAWIFGSADPDAKAVEKVYTTFYRELKKEIEKQSPAGVNGLNKQMSELIPIQNAVLRRIPVEERNNLISLTDSIGLFSTVFNPKALALSVANKATRSGRVGEKIAKAGEAISNPKNAFFQRFIGKYKIDPVDEKALYEYLEKELGIGKNQLLALPVGRTKGEVNNVAIKLPAKSQSTFDKLEGSNIQNQLKKNKLIDTLQGNNSQKMLPAGITKGVSKPINLPAKTQSTLDSIERQILAAQKRTNKDIDTVTLKMIESFKNARPAKYNQVVADIIAKSKIKEKPLTRIEKVILEMRKK